MRRAIGGALLRVLVRFGAGLRRLLPLRLPPMRSGDDKRVGPFLGAEANRTLAQRCEPAAF